MRLIYHARDGTAWDLTELAVACEWAGDYQQGARTLTVKLLYSELDALLPDKPVGEIDFGESMRLYSDEGVELFQGYVFTIDKAGSDVTRTVKCYDGMIYIMKSDIAAKYKKLTPEAITKKVCAALGVTAGALASSGGKKVSFPHIGRPAYDAIMTAYTKAATKNRKYMPRMNGGKLDVILKGAYIARRELNSDSDLTDANWTGSIEDAVTIVRVVNQKGKLLTTFQDKDQRQLYGTLQKVYQKESKPKSTWKDDAKDLLKGPEHTVGVTVIGGPDAFDLLTGNAVVVVDAATGLSGLFYIDSDTHTFESGQHSVQLSLRFDNRMDEKKTN